ncbi:MAG: S8 family serine peptidase [Planctomycetota bacterium]
MKLLHHLSGPIFVFAAVLPAPAEDPPAPTVVALIDTGIDAAHPDLAGALLPAINILHPGKPADDPVLHGTVLAGLIAGRSANPDIRGWAADFPVRVLPIKVSDGEAAKAADLVSAIDAALREKASVICLAFTSPASAAELDAALDRAQKAGALVIAPAGHVSHDFGGFDSQPAAHPWVISCTASREAPLRLPDGKGVAAGRARGECAVAGCAATGETELMLSDEATPLPIKGLPDPVRGLSVACARAAALAAVLRASRPDLSPARLREILVTAGGLPESPDDQATERLRRGSREGVLHWAAKREGPERDAFIGGVQRGFGSKGALRVQVEVGNLGGAPLSGRVELQPPGEVKAMTAEIKDLAPGKRTMVEFGLPEVAFDAVAVVRVVAEGDINPENNATRVVCFPPDDSGVEIHRLRLIGRRDGTTKATVGARLRNTGGEAREVEVAAGVGESDGEDRLTLPAGGFVDVELDFDLPDELELTETPFVFSVKSGGAQVALAGAMLDLSPAEFVPRLDGTFSKRSLSR